jgi:uncharacterized protein (TIGR02594 family)
VNHLTRRSALTSIAGSMFWCARASAATPGIKAIGEDIGSIPDLPGNLQQFQDQNDLNQDMLANYDTAAKGLGPALMAERLTAADIIQRAPTFVASSSQKPIDVARYFLSIAQDKDHKFPQEWPGFMRAWPVRANPLIVEFFTATGTKPSGDTTAWCSAFANWCFLRSRAGRPDLKHLLKPTASAASASWRNWGKGMVYDPGQITPKNGTPREGDIVVFVDRNDSAHGHVCFFVAQEGANLRVLGGNQFEGRPVRHAISEKIIPLWGTTLKIHSIRTDAVLHA